MHKIGWGGGKALELEIGRGLSNLKFVKYQGRGPWIESTRTSQYRRNEDGKSS